MKKVGDINHDKSGIAIPYYLDKTDFVCDWDTAPMHRKAAAIRLRDDAFKLTRLPLEEPIYLGGGDTWMDYTEAKWMSLKALEENIKAVAKNLKDIISSKRGNEVLELGSYPLLSADGKLLLSA